jgi:hypothetical protein
MHESYPPTGDGAIGVGKLYCYGKRGNGEEGKPEEGKIDGHSE